MKSGTSIRDFAVQQLNQRLTDLAFEVHRANRARNPDAIHDLRVSIRRFGQGLRLFPQFFPEWEIEKINKRLRRMMDQSSEVRNRDIALDYLQKHKVADPPLRARLQRERKAHEREFARMVRRWSARDFSAKWRNGLSLNSNEVETSA